MDKDNRGGFNMVHGGGEGRGEEWGENEDN